MGAFVERNTAGEGGDLQRQVATLQPSQNWWMVLARGNHAFAPWTRNFL